MDVLKYITLACQFRSSNENRPSTVSKHMYQPYTLFMNKVRLVSFGQPTEVYRFLHSITHFVS